jgi:hypothetical protein
MSTSHEFQIVEPKYIKIIIFAWVKTQFNQYIKILNNKNGGEFTSMHPFLEGKDLFTSRDVIFHEHTFPLHNLPPEKQDDNILVLPLPNDRIPFPKFDQTHPTHQIQHFISHPR